MDQVATTLAPAAGGDGGGGGGGPLECVERLMPRTAAIYWAPADGTATAAADGAALPIFITQGVLARLRDRGPAGSPPGGAGSLGLLGGHVCQSPDTGERYVVIEATIGPAWRVAGDRTRPVLQGALSAAQRELRASGRRLVGWYHDHPFADAGLSPNDVETHVTFFEQPWQVALVVAPRDKPLGGLFRRSAGAAWSSEPLPFYELLADASLLADGRKVTSLVWQNYCTTDVAVARPPAPAPAAVATPLFFPDEFIDSPTPAARRFLTPRVARVAAYGAVGLLAAGGLLNAYEVVASRWSPRGSAGTRSPVVVSAADRVDRTADTLALALAAFDVRARLFEQRQMGCAELARGLIDVEERWSAYNFARRDAFVLDAARAARDSAQYADVDAVERRFERSPCARP